MRVQVRLGYDEESSGKVVVFEVAKDATAGDIKKLLVDEGHMTFDSKKAELWFRDMMLENGSKLLNAKERWWQEMPMRDWHSWPELERGDGRAGDDACLTDGKLDMQKFHDIHAFQDQQAEMNGIQLVLNFDGSITSHWVKHDYVKAKRPVGISGYHHHWEGKRCYDVRGPGDSPPVKIGSCDLEWRTMELLSPHSIYTVFTKINSHQKFLRS